LSKKARRPQSSQNCRPQIQVHVATVIPVARLIADLMTTYLLSRLANSRKPDRVASAEEILRRILVGKLDASRRMKTAVRKIRTALVSKPPTDVRRFPRRLIAEPGSRTLVSVERDTLMS